MQENNQIQNTDLQEREIDLIKVVARIWEKRKFIIMITVVFMVLGFFVALFSAKEYSVSCTVVPQVRGKAMAGSLGGLAAMAGISLGDLGNGETLSPKVYSNVMKNINLQKELINTVVNFEDVDRPVTLLEYYTSDEFKKFSLKGTIMKYTIGLPVLIIRSIIGDDEKDTLSAGNGLSDIITLTKEELAAVNILREKTGIKLNDKEGSVTITANMPEAMVTAQVAERLVYLLQKYVTEFKIEKAAAQYEFINKQYENACETYKLKQEEYAKFRDANRSISTALASIKEEHLKNEYNLAYSLYSELAKQKVQAEIKVKEDTPVFTIVEPVIVPHEKSKPKHMMILIAYTFVGAVIACGAVLCLDFLKKNFKIKYLDKWE